MSSAPDNNQVNEIRRVDPEKLAAVKAKPDYLRTDDDNALIALAEQLEEEDMFSGSTVFAAPQNSGKQHRLSPRKRGAIAISVAALITAAAVAVVMFCLPEAETDDTSSVNETIPVISVEQSGVEQISVSNGSGEFTIYPSDSESETDEITWLAKGYEDITFLGLDSVAEYACSLRALKILPASDEDIYGLSEPKSTVTVEQKNGEDYTITVGGLSPDQSGNYVTVTGMDGVYLVDKYNMYNFTSALGDMIETASMKPFVPDGDNDEYFTNGSIAMVDKLIFGGTCRPARIVIENPPEEMSVLNYIVTEPTYQAANGDNIDSLLSNFTTGLANSGAFVLRCTDSDLKRYGLDNPYSTVYCKVNKNTVTLKFGKAVDGYYPFTVNDGDIIYKLSADANEWVAYQTADLLYESLYIENVTTLSSVTLSFDGKDYGFKLSPKEDANGSTSLNCTRTDGVKIDDSEFKKLYERIISFTAQETADDGVPNKTPYLTITVKHIDGSVKDSVITFTEYSARRYYYQLNGQGNSLVSSQQIDDVTENTVKVWNGEQITRRTQLTY